MFLSADLPQHVHFTPFMLADFTNQRGDFGDGGIPAGELVESPAETIRKLREPFDKMSVQAASIRLVCGRLFGHRVQQLAAVFFGSEVLFEVRAEGAESSGEFTEAGHTEFTQLADPFPVAVEFVHQSLVVGQKAFGGLQQGDIGGW